MVALANFDERLCPFNSVVGLVEPNPDLGNTGLLIPLALVEVDRQVCVIITNPGDNTISLSLGSTFGELVPATSLVGCTVPSTTMPTETCDRELPSHLQPLIDEVSDSLHPERCTINLLLVAPPEMSVSFPLKEREQQCVNVPRHALHNQGWYNMLGHNNYQWPHESSLIRCSNSTPDECCYLWPR